MSPVITDEARESALAIIKYAKTMIEKTIDQPDMTDETWQRIAISFVSTFKEAGVKMVFNDGVDAGPAVIERVLTDTPREDLGRVFAQIFGKA